jgi:hypothetical protein
VRWIFWVAEGPDDGADAVARTVGSDILTRARATTPATQERSQRMCSEI